MDVGRSMLLLLPFFCFRIRGRSDSNFLTPTIRLLKSLLNVLRSCNRITELEPRKGSQGKPIRPTRDCEGLLGLIRAFWEDLAPPAWALMACMT